MRNVEDLPRAFSRIQPYEGIPDQLLVMHVQGKYAYVVVILGMFLFGGIWYQNNNLPLPLMKSDAISHPGRFIAEYAYFNLRQLTEFGPKVTGSYANEVLAAEFLKREVSYLMAQVNPVSVVLSDHQESTGCYYLGFKPYGFVNCYDRVQNIVTKLTSVNSSGSALLINCHFDSVPGSPGGSDDGLNCVVMLEVLRVLSQAPEPLKHDVIFLFNGAEETPLQASHGFITQHPWARQVKAFVNLEACGAGGREVLFQAGPKHPWLVNYYASSVPYPHGLVVAEDIFQSGWVPSDTDFRIFREFGHIPGLDFAHAPNGYVYHTKFDNMDYIPMGTVQHTGDNILALIKAIGSSDELESTDKYSEGRTVYFDLVGLFMITYSEDIGTIINIVTVFLSLYSQWKILKTVGKGFMHWKLVKLFFASCKITMYGWMLGLGFILATAMLLDVFEASMSWYLHPSLIFPLYFCPMIGSCIFFYLSRGHALVRILSPLHKAQVYSVGVQFMFCSLLLMSTLLGIRSSFVLMLLVALPSLGNLMLITCKKQQSFYVWIFTYLLCVTLAVTFIMYLIILGYSLFIPITGRMGSANNPEIFIGVLSAWVCILSTSLYTPLIVILRRSRKILHQFGILYVLTLVAVLCTPLGFPYSGDLATPAPQRLLVHHTRQIFHHPGGKPYHDASGFWISHIDRHNPGSLKELVPDLAKAESVKRFCDEALYCGLPMFTPRLLPICEHTLWIPAEDPVLHFKSSLKLLKQEWLSDDLVQMTFGVTGPDRMEIYISPNTHVNIMNWTFISSVPDGEPKWKDRPTYFIHFVSGGTTLALNFTLDLKVQSQEEEPMLDIAVVGHYVNTHKISESFETFLKKYPDWVHITAMTSMYASWKF